MTKLFKVKNKKYGSRYSEDLFEQYKLYIESIEKVSDRRQNANNHFVTVNTALISLIGLLTGIKTFDNYCWVKTTLTIIGVIICIIFWYLIRSYKQLNTGKFNVLHKIESKLPLALYKYEWEVLGKGNDKNLYYPFSHIELLIPWIFGAMYLFLGYVFLVLKF